ncbi:MAG: hypothetical protein D3913_16365 [Candidatus Electrothrix sp. LOE1_4_5]|nr:hypothetical protein [Candidatus Electrothrix gigas]
MLFHSFHMHYLIFILNHMSVIFEYKFLLLFHYQKLFLKLQYKIRVLFDILFLFHKSITYDNCNANYFLELH